jgi:hypothetical protein
MSYLNLINLINNEIHNINKIINKFYNNLFKMESTPISACGVHGIAFLECSSEGCDKKTVCKLCAFAKKEDLQHCIDHFDSLKDSNQKELATYSSKTKDYEGYADLNKIYMESIEKASTFTENIFEGINQSKVLIVHQLRDSVFCKYNDATESFEILVKNLTEKLGTVNLSDKKCVDSIKRMKAELEAKTNLLNNTESLVKLFEEKFDYASKRLNNMKIKDIVEKKYNFSGKKNFQNCELTCGSSRINLASLNRQTGTYWTVKSNEILEGAFECKIKIERINPSYANSSWNYCFGLIRASSTNEGSYYNDSVIFQSYGYLAQQFSGSGHTQLFSCLKDGDIVYMKREQNNDVHFAVNDESSYKLGFTNISGPFRIVFGFSSSMNDGIFELEELVLG